MIRLSSLVSTQTCVQFKKTQTQKLVWNSIAARGFSDNRKTCQDSQDEEAATTPAAAEDGDSMTWKWVPPNQSASGVSDAPEYTSAFTESDVIEVKPMTLLSSTEIAEALKKMGGENVRRIPIEGRIDNVKEFIIASGSSSRHLRKMANAIVQALKSRQITKAMGYHGAEGGANDDWLLVDCYDRVVHLMLPSTRSALNLEEHWSQRTEDLPVVRFNHREKEYEKEFERLLEDHPVPEDWNDNAATTTPATDPKLERKKLSSNKKSGVEFL